MATPNGPGQGLGLVTGGLATDVLVGALRSGHVVLAAAGLTRASVGAIATTGSGAPSSVLAGSGTGTTSPEAGSIVGGDRVIRGFGS